MKFMKTLLTDDALIVSGLHLIDETSTIQFPDRRPLFDQVYKVAKKYQDSRYMPYFHAEAFIKAYDVMSKRYNDNIKNHGIGNIRLIDLND